MHQLDDIALDISGDCSRLFVYFINVNDLDEFIPVEYFSLKFQTNRTEMIWGARTWDDSMFKNMTFTKFVETWRQGCTT